MNDKIIICIGRQFGSGGHEIGQTLAKQLEIPLYDKEIIEKAAQDNGIATELFERADEKPLNSFLFASSIGATGHGINFTNYDDYLTNSTLFSLQSEVIKTLANEGSGIFIGRCADYILRTIPGRLSVFIHAPLERRIQRISVKYKLEEDAARNLIKKTDKSRGNYYSFYADQDWGAATTYDLCLNAQKLGTEKTVKIITDACK